MMIVHRGDRRRKVWHRGGQIEACPGKQLKMKLRLMSATRFGAFQSNQPQVNEYPEDVFGKWGSISAFAIKGEYAGCQNTHDTVGKLMEYISRHRQRRQSTCSPQKDESHGKSLCSGQGTDESFTSGNHSHLERVYNGSIMSNRDNLLHLNVSASKPHKRQIVCYRTTSGTRRVRISRTGVEIIGWQYLTTPAQRSTMGALRPR